MSAKPVLKCSVFIENVRFSKANRSGKPRKRGFVTHSFQEEGTLREGHTATHQSWSGVGGKKAVGTSLDVVSMGMNS